MRTKICDMLGIDVPIFAFSHCRDVVVEAGKSGGLGVLGAATFSPRQLETELKWIDEHLDGRPYGIDIIMPNNTKLSGDLSTVDFDKVLPKEHRDFVEQILERQHVPPLPEDEIAQIVREQLDAMKVTREGAEELMEVALGHASVKLVVNAMGIPPKQSVERLHKAGILVASLVGTVDHAINQVAAGIDVIIAVGTEAGGHAGGISTMVLVPRVVDAVTPVPVLAAGGIGRGRQVVAGLALGAQGVWCGTIWLGTAQSDLTPGEKDIIFAADESDAVVRRVYSGKTCRVIRNDFTEAWEQPGAPEPLPYPLQPLLTIEALARIDRSNRADLAFLPAGQVVADVRQPTSVRQIYYDMLSEFSETVESLRKLTE